MSEIPRALSRRQITELLQDAHEPLLTTHNVVSMLDTGMVSPFITSVFSGFPAIQDFRSSLLTMHVDDVGEESGHWFHPFTPTHADRLATWFDLADKQRPFLVHCWAGVSRSGAVGLWLAERLGYTEEEYLNANPRVRPNPYIIQVLRQCT